MKNMAPRLKRAQAHDQEIKQKTKVLINPIKSYSLNTNTDNVH